MIRADFHTHTSFCDGKNTVEQMARAAYDAGITALGFSGHGYVAHDESYCMSQKDTELYIREVTEQKQIYAGKMNILLGLEADLFSQYDKSRYDYIIGSVHYIEASGDFFDVDNTPEILKSGADSYFGGDIYAVCERYFELVSQIKDVDFVGHFDLITKFCEACPNLIDQSNPRYRTAAITALDTLIERGLVLEVNTGAMARGYRTSPYPSTFILERIRERGGSVILSGDAHDTRGICNHFDTAEKILKSVGFKSVMTLTENGFISTDI